MTRSACGARREVDRVARGRTRGAWLVILGGALAAGCGGSDPPIDQGFATSTTGQASLGGGIVDAGVGTAVAIDGAAQGQGANPSVATGGVDGGDTLQPLPGADAGLDAAAEDGDAAAGVDASAGAEAGVDAPTEPGSVVNAAGMPTSCPDPVLELSDPPFEVTSTPMLYEVDADTLPGIRQQMTLRSPASMAGAVEWYVWWDFDWRACDGTGLAVGVDVNYILPRWTQPDSAQPEVVEGWAGYIDALWCHEYGHTQFGLDVADESYQALAQLAGKVGGCTALRREADRLFQEILERYAELEAAYDRDTDHGATMGARLPTDRD